MRIIETDLPGCLVIEPRQFGDSRGWFMESWNRDRYAGHGIGPDFLQSNLSRSAKGVLRGLHYQWPDPQGKLVSVLEGEVYDVAVDIRLGSPRYGQWTAAILSAENRRQLWVPPGFAHGFVALSETTLVSYLCTAAYDAEADAALCWDDPDLAIDWPVARPQLSAKDTAAPRLGEVDAARLPEFEAP
ncbi:dTDP-4-dehydrorhamnose 3,5-epimerase [Luteimonas sp. JM171]|uniref:dTDP-4-dehydrorhamnose 3,5-epimerase n=1 Tax=Luteimonas sp. JM171 TaxID=1896164 RepID=UPI000855D717|nr:dTDP-4-dehydrorhamnose 3,5-epimerase [Luteimonas sp. JM171]AOH36150.1 dTDP-4-dehydrorhamnose 3,5-epimerase [Luteimonas sp. JM171]